MVVMNEEKEKLEKELEFLKESFDSEVISEEEFLSGKERIQKHLSQLNSEEQKKVSEKKVEEVEEISEEKPKKEEIEVKERIEKSMEEVDQEKK